MRIHLVNPSDISFGTAVITPRWLYVLAAATPREYGDPRVVDETLDPIDFDSIASGDAVTPLVIAVPYYVVERAGWGHLIGMSQYGAQAMAEAGSPYPDILAHYYGGLTPVPGDQFLPEQLAVGLVIGSELVRIRSDGPLNVVVDGVPVETTRRDPGGSYGRWRSAGHTAKSATSRGAGPTSSAPGANGRIRNKSLPGKGSSRRCQKQHL